jgi:hypothetical protein
MTEQLEPELLAGLNALVAEHTTFILGFSIARKLLENSIAIRNLEEGSFETKKATAALLVPLIGPIDLLSEKAKKLFGSLLKALNAFENSSNNIIAASHASGRNCLIAVGNVIHAVAASHLFETIAVSDAALQAAGFEHVELVRASIDFLTNNADVVMAFSSSSPQMSIWLSWLLEKMLLSEGAYK